MPRHIYDSSPRPPRRRPAWQEPRRTKTEGEQIADLYDAVDALAEHELRAHREARDCRSAAIILRGVIEERMLKLCLSPACYRGGAAA